MITSAEIIGQFDKIAKTYQSYSNIPNLFDVVSLNENAHTRVLHMLLNHRRENTPVFLKSFLEGFSEEFKKLTKSELVSSEISQQWNHIDCFIRVGKYAIVIENKINGAKDQDQQLETYITKSGCNIKFVYAIYLTLTGGEPSEVSLSNETKIDLGDRLINVTYMTHVLDWLKNDVLPECKVREALLENSVRIYIDYLNGMLGQKNHERKLIEDLAKITKLQITPEYYHLLQQTLSNNPLETGDIILEKHENFSSSIQLLLREIESKIPYINEDNVAYVLKYMLQNCPPWKEKSTWVDNCANIDPFTPGYFMYHGSRYLKLSGLNLEIHLRCSTDGIKIGPYILLDPQKADERFGKENLEAIGLIRDQWYSLPFCSFNMKKTSLLEVALHVKLLVDRLKQLPSLRCMLGTVSIDTPHPELVSE